MKRAFATWEDAMDNKVKDLLFHQLLASPLRYLLWSSWWKAELTVVGSSRRKIPAPLGVNFPCTHSLPLKREIPMQCGYISLVSAKVTLDPLVCYLHESDAEKFWKRKVCCCQRWYKQTRKQRRQFLSSWKKRPLVSSNKARFKKQLGFPHLINHLITTSFSHQHEMQEAHNHFPGQMLKRHCI